jgi:enoyl-CoA hydratase/carnithine racemase
VLGAELVDSSTALAWDVVDEVVAEEDVLARALEVAQERSGLPPNTYELIKRRVRAGASAATRGMLGNDDGARWTPPRRGRPGRPSSRTGSKFERAL